MLPYAAAAITLIRHAIDIFIVFHGCRDIA